MADRLLTEAADALVTEANAPIIVEASAPAQALPMIQARTTRTRRRAAPVVVVMRASPVRLRLHRGTFA